MSFISLSSSHIAVLPVGRHCPLDEFQCNNTLCKPLGWKCDGEDDCGDNSDEDAEHCGENQCVLSAFLKTAEYRAPSFLMFLSFCPLVNFQCPPTRQFRCRNDRVCLSLSKRCDGVNNCGDNSDEVNCRKFVCLFNHFKEIQSLTTSL